MNETFSHNSVQTRALQKVRSRLSNRGRANRSSPTTLPPLRYARERGGGRGEEVRRYPDFTTTKPAIVLPSSRVTMIWCSPAAQLSVRRLKRYRSPTLRIV